MFRHLNEYGTRSVLKWQTRAWKLSSSSPSAFSYRDASLAPGIKHFNKIGWNPTWQVSPPPHTPSYNPDSLSEVIACTSDKSNTEKHYRVQSCSVMSILSCLFWKRCNENYSVIYKYGSLDITSSAPPQRCLWGALILEESLRTVSKKTLYLYPPEFIPQNLSPRI